MSNVTKVNLGKPAAAPSEESEVYKVDLSKPVETEATEEKEAEETNSETTEEVVAEETSNEEESSEEQQEEVVLEEVTEEEEEVEQEQQEEKEIVAVASEPKEEKNLPEGIEKLISFMEETGGSLDDYAKLNADYSNFSDDALLKEYYQATKPHLDKEEVNFLIEDTFEYDEDIDEDREIKRKKVAKKEALAKAKRHLDGLKNQYYTELKAGSRLTPDQKKAVDFFNRYNKENEENAKVAEQQTSTFLNKTNSLFSEKFKGFEYNIGEKKFRFNVKDAGAVKESQSDINNFIGKFLDNNGNMKDAKGYHKSLFTATNADAIANHFYEQGKADALKTSIAKSKNIDMGARSSSPETNINGLKVKVLSDNSSSKLSIKKK